jgi:hypothetical protein
MKKIIFILLTFLLISSCKSPPDIINDSKKTDKEEVPQTVETEPLPAQESNEPQIPEVTEIVIAEDDASSAFEEFNEPEIFDEIAIAEDEPEPVIIEEEIFQPPEPVIAVIEAPPEKKEQEIIPEVQVRPPVPQPVVPQILVRPEQETVPQAPPVEEKPLQAVINPVEEEPLASESPPPAPYVPSVSELKNEPVIPPQSLLVIPPNNEIIYSRTVRATVGQIIEIPFRGTGWVYLGELVSRRGINYDSRRLDPEGQSFIFRVTEAGTYSLKFFKEDFIRDYILNDYVMVIAGEAPQTASGWFNPPQDRGRVTAQPRWPSNLDEAEMRRTGVSTAVDNTSTPSVSTASDRRGPETQAVTAAQDAPQRQEQSTVSSQSGESQNRVSARDRSEPSINADDKPQTDSMALATPFSGNPDELLKNAKDAFDEGKIQAAISFLDQYKYFFPSGSDEAYWLYGQFYEANTPGRNILLALDYYKRLISEYPQSSRCNDAGRRIQYLQRFYININ